MSLELLESYFHEVADRDDLLFSWRKRAWDQFSRRGLPQKKEEAFRYVPLQKLKFPPLNFSKKSPVSFRMDSKESDKVIVLSLKEAMRSYGIFLQNRLSKLLKEEQDPFALLNGAILEEGLFIYVLPHQKIEEPIVLEHLFEQGKFSVPRVHFYLGKNAKAEIVLSEKGDGVSNLFIDVLMDQSSELFFYDTSELEKKAHRLSSFRASLKKEAKLSIFSHQKGSEISRSSIQIELLEENSEVCLQGITSLNEKNEHHIHAKVEHKAPSCKSRQHFKTILNDQSFFTFEGKIYVEAQAQKTEGYQLCNNLLLSDEAKAFAKPNLEIFADDVKASHGATFGSLNAEMLFYLRSRGLSKEEARKWLVKGFYKEILDPLPPFIKAYL